MSVLDGIFVSLRQVDDALATYLPQIGLPQGAVPAAAADMNAILIGALAGRDYTGDRTAAPKDKHTM